MIQLLPEPKMAEDFEKTTININAIYFCGEISDELRKLARERFWNYQDIKINEAYLNEKLRVWLPHFDKLENAERRNAIIYDMVLAALAYEDEKDEKKKEQLLDEILYYNEQDFDIVKEMFFDVNPVTETGVGSCMFPYHEMKRIIHNIRHPEAEDKNVISSGVEAFGWLWL